MSNDIDAVVIPKEIQQRIDVLPESDVMEILYKSFTFYERNPDDVIDELEWMVSERAGFSKGSIFSLLRQYVKLRKAGHEHDSIVGEAQLNGRDGIERLSIIEDLKSERGYDENLASSLSYLNTDSREVQFYCDLVDLLLEDTDRETAIGQFYLIKPNLQTKTVRALAKGAYEAIREEGNSATEIMGIGADIQEKVVDLARAVELSLQDNLDARPDDSRFEVAVSYCLNTFYPVASIIAERGISGLKDFGFKIQKYANVVSEFYQENQNIQR